jgi:UDP-N-acetylmuramate dehydrogenase
MSQYTSFGIGGAADVMAFPKDESDLKDLMSFAHTKKFPLFILGGGTNLLVKDRGMEGIVVNMCEGFKDIVWTDDTNVVVGAGVTLSLLLKRCKERGLSGLEFSAGIPGTVGGATMMNAGAYGSELSSVVEGVEVLNLKGKKSFIPAKDVGFSYRGSSLPSGSVVIRVHMSFKVEDR